MASGSQNMTTYNARTVTGSNSAASPAGALLLSGAGRADDATGDTWIFLDSSGGTSTPWGIKHDQANNKIQIFGAGTNSVWTEMDTGNTYIGGSLNTGSTLTVRAQDDAHEGGEIILSPATDSFSTVHIDAYDSIFRLHDGTNERFKVDISTGNATINGNLGIGADYAVLGGSYKLYVDGSTRINSALHIFPNSANYTEGIRIHSYSSWSDITLCGNDNTGDTGISTNSWFIGNNNGSFYISRNGSPGATAYLSCINNVWNFLNQVTFGARVTSTAPSALTNVDRIVITPYYHTGGPWKITSRDDSNNAYLSLYYSTTETARMQHNGALLLCNNISFTNSGTAFRGINYGTMGDNDQWRIGGAATAANAGYMELATADDGNEPIYVRQYTGVFSSLKRTLTLLDASGNTYLPGRLFVASNSDVGLNSGSGAIVIGSTSGTSIGIDDNEIMARSNSKASTLYLNSEGGQVYVGSGGVNVAGQVAATWLRVVNDSSNNSDDATVYIQSQTANDWALKIVKGGKNYGIRVDSLDQSEAIWTNGYVRARCVWANQGSNGERQVGVDSSTSGTIYFWSNTTNKGIYSGSGYSTGTILSVTSSGRVLYCHDTWGNKVRMVDNWIGFYGSTHGGTRYGFIQCDANRMYFRKENGVSTYHFDMNGGYLLTSRCYNAVWNDYAECRAVATEEPGRCVMESPSGEMQMTTKRLEPGCKIISDTYGTCIGATDTIKIPIAVSGRVLAYPYQDRNNYSLGAAVCSGPNGTVDLMTRDEIMMYPERIVGIVSEIPSYEIWHCGSKDLPEEVHVNGRIWIYVR